MKHIKLFEEFILDLSKFNIKESFTYADAVENTGEDVKEEEKGIALALKALKARSVNDIAILTDTTEDDGEDLYDAIKKMKSINIDSMIYDQAYVGKFMGKDVVVFGSDGDLFAYVKESISLNEGKVSPDKVAQALYGTNANNAPTMTAFLNVRPGDMVTIVSPSLTQGSELLVFANSINRTVWMAEKSVFGSNTLYAAFKNMSQDDFDLLKAQFPKADVVDLDMYEPMKAKAKATASMKKLSNVDSVADASAKY